MSKQAQSERLRLANAHASDRNENESFATAYFRRGNDLEMTVRLDLEVWTFIEATTVARIESIETRHKFYSSKSFPRSKINRAGDRKDKLSIDYSSRSWLSVNYERMAIVWCLRKLELENGALFFKHARSLCFLNIERATSFARKQEFDSLFCFGNPRISARRVSNRWHVRKSTGYEVI